jgi:hypothetical protein
MKPLKNGNAQFATESYCFFLCQHSCDKSDQSLYFLPFGISCCFFFYFKKREERLIALRSQTHSNFSSCLFVGDCSGDVFRFGSSIFGIAKEIGRSSWMYDNIRSRHW